MELTNAQKSRLLNEAVDLMEQADALIQRALGATDVCYETCTQLQNVIDDVITDIVEFDDAH